MPFDRKRVAAALKQHGAGIVEVKTRGSYADAAEAILPQQQARIRRATEWLLASRPDLAELTIRFDAVLVLPARWPQHLVGAYLTA